MIGEPLKAALKILKTSNGNLGGDACGGGMYGELTVNSMRKAFALTVDKDSMVLDIGSGVGRPILVAATEHGCIAIGAEISELRYCLSMAYLRNISFDVNINCPACFKRCDIMDVESFHPFTVIYAFDAAFEPTLIKHMADTINNSPSVKYVLSCRKLVDFGCKVVEVNRFSAVMCGSGERH